MRASCWVTTQSTMTFSPVMLRCWRQHVTGRVRSAVCSLFSHGLPVRSREEPDPFDQGICTLPRSVQTLTLPGTSSSAATGRSPRRSSKRSSRAAATRRSTALGFCSPMRCRGGMLTPVHSCFRVSPSPGDLSSMKLPPVACRFSSHLAPAAPPCSYRSLTVLPEVDLTRSTSRP